MATTYTLTAQPDTIIRDEDGAFVPADEANVDYQEYLRWLKVGNKPKPPAPAPKAKPHG